MFAHLHGVEASQSGATPVLPSSFLAGLGGVDLFFVISGFIMVWVAGDATPGWRNAFKFLFARVTRIYPLWWLFAGAMAAYFWISSGVPWDRELLAQLGVDGEAHLIKSFFLIPHDALPVLTLGWTLMHEMYFYIVFAFVLVLPRDYRGPVLMTWAIIVFSAMVTGRTDFYASTFASLALYPMTLEFLMGAGIGWIVKSGANRLAIPALVIGIGMFAIGMLTINFTSLDNALPIQRTLVFGPASALILYAVAVLEIRRERAAWARPQLVRLGDWSYSLYLGHLLAISAVAQVFFPLFGMAGPFDNLIFLIAAGAAAIVVAGLTFAWFERPSLTAARRLRNALFAAPPRQDSA